MVDRPRASRARQSLVAAEAARAAHVQELLSAKEMVAGSFITKARLCGKPGCRCVTGEKHEAKYLSRSVEGRTNVAYVRASDEVEVETKAERYRAFRQARAELMKLAAQTAEWADEIEAAITEPYPPSGERGERTIHGRRRR